MLKQVEKVKGIYAEYPRTFWTLIAITFIDRVGGAMLFPFFALYLTKKFDIGMTQVGVLFAAFSFSSFIGSMLGGALTDRLGRKGIIIFVGNGLCQYLYGLLLHGAFLRNFVRNLWSCPSGYDCRYSA